MPGRQRTAGECGTGARQETPAGLAEVNVHFIGKINYSCLLYLDSITIILAAAAVIVVEQAEADGIFYCGQSRRY
jgi:hypothetical protein